MCEDNGGPPSTLQTLRQRRCRVAGTVRPRTAPRAEPPAAAGAAPKERCLPEKNSHEREREGRRLAVGVPYPRTVRTSVSLRDAARATCTPRMRLRTTGGGRKPAVVARSRTLACGPPVVACVRFFLCCCPPVKFCCEETRSVLLLRRPSCLLRTCYRAPLFAHAA